MTNKIKTISELWDLVEEDNEEHIIKDIAKLLLAANNDWPDDIQNIDNFITTIKKYFGSLTIDCIDSKKFDGNNAWKLEAGSSIREMIKLSNHSDFYKTLDEVLNYYDNR